MEQKKYSNHDINSKRFLFLNIGMCISLLFVITAFEWRTEEKSTDNNWVGCNFRPPINLTVPEQPLPIVLGSASLKEIDYTEEETDFHLVEAYDESHSNYFEIHIKTHGQLSQDQIHDIVDIPPKPSQGFASFYKYLASNIQFPSGVTQSNIQERVFIRFVVERNGQLSNIEIVNEEHRAFSEELVQLLKNGPTWKPGIYEGVPVRARTILPIKFTTN